MKRTQLTTRTTFLFALVLVLVLCLVAMLSANLQATAYVEDPSATVGEIFNEDNGLFNEVNIKLLLNELLYDDSSSAVSIDALQTAIGSSSTTNTGKEYSSTMQIAEKNIIVEFGGVKWIAVFLSLADTNLTNDNASLYGTGTTGNKPKDNDVILTLWQATGTDTASWIGDAIDYGTNQTNSNGKYPANMYGTSHIRAVTLNNGGKYATSKDGDLTIANQNSSSPYAKFNQTGNIKNYLIAPRYLEWQKNLKIPNWKDWSQAGKSHANDAWGNQGKDEFFSDEQGVVYWYEENDNYRQWMDDLIWLPAMAETGYNNKDGLWLTTQEQRQNDGNSAWTRTGSHDYYYARNISDEGGYGSSSGASQFLVRPALHLNLTVAVEHVSHDLEYKDDGAGNHFKQCTLCGYETNYEAHTVEFAKSTSDSQHQGICKVCNLIVAQKHTTTQKHDITAHWDECVICNVRLNQTIHDWDNLGWKSNGDTDHTSTCSTCSESKTVDHTLGEYQQDAQGHYKACTANGCDYELHESHQTNGDYTAATNHDLAGHWQTCSECNGKLNVATHEWSGMPWQTSEGKHFKQCTICAQHYGEGEHTLQTHAQVDANCTNTGVSAYTYCGVCSTYFSDTAGNNKISIDIEQWKQGAGRIPTNNNHSYDSDWHYDGSSGHYHVCEYNPAHHTGSIAHNYNNTYYNDGQNHYQVCEDCNYETTHNTHSVSGWSTNGNESHSGLCVTCNLTVTGAHDWNTTTLSYDDDGHWYGCNSTSCTERKDYQAHNVTSWTNANTKHQGNCDDCDKTGISQAHNLGNYVDDGKGNHYQNCEDCTYATQEQAHKVEAATSTSDSQHQGLCTVCKLSVTENHKTGSLQHNVVAHWNECEVCKKQLEYTKHEWGNGTFKWNRTDDTTHKATCATCNEFTTGEHEVTTWSNDSGKHSGQCTICSDTVTADHILSALLNDESGYYQECTAEGCEYRVNYSDIGDVHVHQYNQLKYNASAHWYACDCGALQSVAAHSGGTWVTDSSSHYKECETCKQHYNSGDHVKIYTGNNDSQHDVACAICDWTDSENHSKSALQHNASAHWYDCSVCKEQVGYVEHIWGNEPFKWSKTDNSTHKASCSTCNEFVTGNHEVSSWSLSGSGNHSGQCGVCSGMVTQGHTLGALIKADDGYYQKCTANGCTYETEHHDIGDVHVHSYDMQEHDDVHHWMECVCGARNDIVEHDDSIWKHDGNNHYKECATCQATYGEGEHIKTYTSKDDNEHNIGCAICDWTTSANHSKGAIQHNAYAHWYDCSVCKQQVNYTVHNWDTATWTSVDSSTHKSTCSTCGEVTTEKHSLSGLMTDSNGTYQKCTATGCTYETDRQPVEGESHIHSFDTQKSDETYHWNECECGARKDVKQHVWDKNGWVEVDSDTHKAICESCGKVVTQRHNFHLNDDDEGYWLKCENCGFATDKTAFPSKPSEPDPNNPNEPKPTFWERVKAWFKDIDDWFNETPLSLGYTSVVIGTELLLIIILAIVARKPKNY